MRTLQSIAPKKNAFRSAFTLIEVMIASMIGAIVFAGLFYALNQGTSLIQMERENLRATQILTGKIEAIRLCAWGISSGTNIQASQLFNSSIVPTTFTEYFYPSSLGGFATNSMAYTGTITISTNFTYRTITTNGVVSTNSPPSYSNSIARVIVTLAWSEVHYGQTNSFSRTSMTYISANGIQNYLSSY